MPVFFVVEICFLDNKIKESVYLDEIVARAYFKLYELAPNCKYKRIRLLKREKDSELVLASLSFHAKSFRGFVLKFE